MIAGRRSENGSFDDDGERIDGYIEMQVLSEKICESCGSILGRRYNIPDKMPK